MEPRNGIILTISQPPYHQLMFEILCVVPTLVWTWDQILICGVPPFLSPCSGSLCGVPPSQFTFFLCSVPPQCSFVPLPHSSLCWKVKLGIWHFARTINLAQLVSPSVELPAELVLNLSVSTLCLLVFLVFMLCYFRSLSLFCLIPSFANLKKRSSSFNCI